MEPFRGNREKYHDWKKLQSSKDIVPVGGLGDGPLDLSREGEAGQVLNQLEISDIQSDGRLQRVLRLLNDAFGARSVR